MIRAFCTNPEAFSQRPPLCIYGGIRQSLSLKETCLQQGWSFAFCDRVTSGASGGVASHEECEGETMNLGLRMLWASSTTCVIWECAGELCCVVVDELHMIRDPARGLLLELLLCKLLLSWQARGVQIIGMSATMGGVLQRPSPGLTLYLKRCLKCWTSIVFGRCETPAL